LSRRCIVVQTQQLDVGAVTDYCAGIFHPQRIAAANQQGRTMLTLLPAVNVAAKTRQPHNVNKMFLVRIGTEISVIIVQPYVTVCITCLQRRSSVCLVVMIRCINRYFVKFDMHKAPR
jgi:hypothetical protein